LKAGISSQSSSDIDSSSDGLGSRGGLGSDGLGRGGLGSGGLGLGASKSASASSFVIGGTKSVSTSSSSKGSHVDSAKESFVTFEKFIVSTDLEILPAGDEIDLEESDLIDSREKADTIYKAGVVLMDDVRVEVSSPTEILRRLESFRDTMPDRYQAAFISLSTTPYPTINTSRHNAPTFPLCV
jgi:hypothetical protein